jgi:hypothetical protein
MSKRALDRTEIEEETESEERSYRFEDNEHLVSVATKRSIFFPWFSPLQKHWLLYSQGGLAARLRVSRVIVCCTSSWASASRHYSIYVERDGLTAILKIKFMDVLYSFWIRQWFFILCS